MNFGGLPGAVGAGGGGAEGDKEVLEQIGAVQKQITELKEDYDEQMGGLQEEFSDLSHKLKGFFE